MRIAIITCFVLLFGVRSISQEVFPSNTYVRTCISDIECSSINSSSYLFYDENRHKFYIKIDFSIMKTGIDSVDFWLEDLAGTFYYFKASLPPEYLPNLSNYNHKTLHLSGQSYLNGVWRPKTIDITVFRAEGDMMSNETDANELSSLMVNYNFSFSPKDYNIHKKPHGLRNTIFVGVGSGRINSLKFGMENLLGEAFEHVD